MTNLTDQRTEEQAIDRLLRCRKTRRFFKGDGWTEDASEASLFRDQMEAVQACIEHDLRDIELVLRAAGTHSEIFCTAIR